MKVTVMARIREGKKYPFVQPVWLGTRLKPGAVILKDAEGKPVEVKRDDVAYYLRYTRHGKQVTEPAGKHPKDVYTFRERILATLAAEAHGLAVSGGNIIPMAQSAPVSSRTTIQQAVAGFLSRKAKDPDLRRGTVGGYANTLGQWLGWCRKQYLDEVVRDDAWIEGARLTLSRLSEGSPNEFFAIHIPTNEIVARANVGAPKRSEDTNEDLLTEELPTDEKITERALELYENRWKDGRGDGKAAIDDWLNAKKQLWEERRKGAKS